MNPLYMSDPRRRLVDLKNDGYILESRKCQQHDYHRGGSKEWSLIGREDAPHASNPALQAPSTPEKVFNPIQEVISALKEQTLLFK